jgi:4-hydroxy-2-oxoheptanedioate aldolase
VPVVVVEISGDGLSPGQYDGSRTRSASTVLAEGQACHTTQACDARRVISNRTKAKLLAGEPVFGVISRTHDANIAEVLALRGWDFAVFDGEHGALGPREWEHLARVVELRNATPLARVPSHDPSAILRALDTGMAGVHVPHIESAAEATAVVRAAYFWPKGDRGLAGTRAAAFAQAQPLHEYVVHANRETLVAVHVETGAGVERAEEIASVPGVDVVFLGAIDLSQSLGVPGHSDHPSVRAAMELALQGILSQGCAAGVVATSGEAAHAWVARGVRYVLVSLEGLLASASSSYLASARGTG